VCGTSITPMENDLEELLVWYFPKFGKVKEMRMRRYSDFMLLGQSVVEKIQVLWNSIYLVCSSVDLLRIYNVFTYFSKKYVTRILCVFRWDISCGDV
jgi:hypothetical protein